MKVLSNHNFKEYIMQELKVEEIKIVNGGAVPVIAWAILEGAAGLAGIFGGGWALGHYLYSDK